MNIQRGFFRIWIIASAIFVAIVLIYSFDSIKSEFEAASQSNAFDKVAITLVPIERGKVRGNEQKDYKCDGVKAGNNQFDQFDICWYEVPKFRQLYPEYNDLTDKNLSYDLYEKAGKSLKIFSPWTRLMETLIIAFGIPLVALFIGRSLLWAVAGFKSA